MTDFGWRFRCDWCDWPLADSAQNGCTAHNCSRRPLPELGEVGELKQELRKAVHALVTRRDGPPGEWKCRKCDFVISQAQEIPDCQNGCGPMRPLTWRETCDMVRAGAEWLAKRLEQRDGELRKAEAEIRRLADICGEQAWAAETGKEDRGGRQ